MDRQRAYTWPEDATSGEGSVKAEILEGAPDAPIEVLMWRKAIFQAISDANAGDAEAAVFFRTEHFLEMARLAAFDPEKIRTILFRRYAWAKG